MIDELREEGIVNKVGGRFSSPTASKSPGGAERRCAAAGGSRYREQDADRRRGDQAG